MSVLEGWLTPTKKRPLIHRFTFATPTPSAPRPLPSFCHFPPHPLTLRLNGLTFLTQGLFLSRSALASQTLTHTHATKHPPQMHTLSALTLQRWVCELGQQCVYFSSGQCSRQLPLLFIVGGWMEFGGEVREKEEEAAQGWPVGTEYEAAAAATSKVDKWMTPTFPSGQQPHLHPSLLLHLLFLILVVFFFLPPSFFSPFLPHLV